MLLVAGTQRGAGAGGPAQGRPRRQDALCPRQIRPTTRHQKERGSRQKIRYCPVFNIKISLSYLPSGAAVLCRLKCNYTSHLCFSDNWASFDHVLLAAARSKPLRLRHKTRSRLPVFVLHIVFRIQDWNSQYKIIRAGRSHALALGVVLQVKFFLTRRIDFSILVPYRNKSTVEIMARVLAGTAARWPTRKL